MELPLMLFVDRFHTYWKSVMLDKQTVAIADSLLENWATNFLYDNHYKDFISDIEEWKGINLKLIKEKSRLLFDTHSRNLEERGSKTVTHLITEG